jgi:pheromone shutdown protein TraB
VITLVGTGHIFDLRRRIQDEIFRRSPTMVAIELDPGRFQALRHPEAAKGGPVLYRMLANMQQKMAGQYGTEAGNEMVAAADAAQDLQVPLALIDRDAGEVLRRVWREMGFREKVRAMGALAFGFVAPSRNVEADLERIQDDYAGTFEELGRKFPTIRRVVIDERDDHMANTLADLAKSQSSLVAILGDGHIDGIAKRLASRGVEFETVRLRDLRGRDPPGPEPQAKKEPASVTYRVEYKF